MKVSTSGCFHWYQGERKEWGVCGRYVEEGCQLAKKEKDTIQ